MDIGVIEYAALLFNLNAVTSGFWRGHGMH